MKTAFGGDSAMPTEMMLSDLADAVAAPMAPVATTLLAARATDSAVIVARFFALSRIIDFLLLPELKPVWFNFLHIL